jgi:hypothetical protein
MTKSQTKLEIPKPKIPEGDFRATFSDLSFDILGFAWDLGFGALVGTWDFAIGI